MASREESATFQSVRVSENVQLLASGTSSFALELYKQLTKRSTGNVFLSPLSISTVLSMAYVGAKGNTAAQLKKAMFLEDLEDFKLQQAFADIRRYLNDVIVNRDYSDEPLFQVCMENRLFAEKTYPFLEAFQTSCRQYHDAETANVDFIGNPSKTAEQINTWVSESTKGKINEIISSDDINSSTRLLLLGAIYFKSAWNDQFEPHNTQEADFHVSSSETRKVQLMFRKVKEADYSFSPDLQCQILKITYLYGALSMFILLPDKSTTSLDELEGKLTADHLKNIDVVLGISSGLQFWLPKFKIEAQMELTDVLRDIGIKDLFDDSAADLSGMDNTKELVASKVVHKAYVDVNEEGTEADGATSVTFKIKADVLRDIGIKDLLGEGAADLSGMDNTRLLYASKVVHKAYVDVNEKGTEAAGATSMTIEARCGSFTLKTPGPVEFRADHPFLFFIREEFAKVIVFLGRVVKPQSTS